MILRTGEVNLEAMALLDGGHVAKFGHPEPSPVRLDPKKGKGILVSGHDLEVGGCGLGSRQGVCGRGRGGHGPSPSRVQLPARSCPLTPPTRSRPPAPQDLRQLLEQTAGTGSNVYTHGAPLLPAAAPAGCTR